MIIALIIYMLVGAQIGGRVFYWSTLGKNDVASYVFCLGVIPITWPVIIVLSFSPKTDYFSKAIWRWYDREVPPL